MSYTGTELFNMAIAIIDELSDTGTVNDAQIKEYKYRAPYLLDLWQGGASGSGDLFKTYEVSCFRKTNNLIDTTSFRTVEHLDTDLTYETDKKTNCFFFSVDSAASVYVEELIAGTWTNCNGTYITDGGVATAFVGLINAVGNTSSYKDYKGILSPASPTNKIRLRFSGSYYYRFANRALSPNKYQTADKVPDFKPWYKLDMPADFKSRTQVVDEYSDWQYEEDTSHKWENGNELFVQFGYEGIIRINYIPLPGKITSLTQAIEVDEITARSGAHYLAKYFALSDQNTDLANVCSAAYKEIKQDSMIKQPLTNSEIIDIYS
jgi:hypothetical protein